MKIRIQLSSLCVIIVGIHPAVIAGIASRESRAGKMLYSTNGWGDHHHAYGIMQVYTT